MTKPIARDPMYRKSVFDADIIELCVRWPRIPIFEPRPDTGAIRGWSTTVRQRLCF
jgi:hypothetical protein